MPPGGNSRYTVTLTIKIGVFDDFTRYIYPLQGVTGAVTQGLEGMWWKLRIETGPTAVEWFTDGVREPGGFSMFHLTWSYTFCACALGNPAAISNSIC